MKVVILAGGLGTRISEETTVKPKPMIEIGDMPILWHIMKIYASYGYNDFIICLGYKGYVIKEYFSNYFLHKSDVIINLKDNSIKAFDTQAEPWTITLVDTGISTMTGGRIKRIMKYTNSEPFLLTYGDGVADINIDELIKFHKQTKKLCTVTSVQPSGRFGALNIDGLNQVTSFLEKPRGDGSWINGGFFVCEQGIFDYLENDSTVFEREPMEMLASDLQMSAFKHGGFWKPMDTLRDKHELDEEWSTGRARWKVW